MKKLWKAKAILIIRIKILDFLIAWREVQMRKNKEKRNMLSDFYKQNKNDKIWWIDDLDSIGKHMFSFDKIKIFNLFADYPYNLTPEEKEIFDKENPYWKDFFKERTK